MHLKLSLEYYPKQLPRQADLIAVARSPLHHLSLHTIMQNNVSRHRQSSKFHSAPNHPHVVNSASPLEPEELHPPRALRECEEELVIPPSTSEAELGSTDLRLVDQLRGGHDPK